VRFPGEVGTVRPGRKGRLFLEPTNIDELLAVEADCADVTLRHIHPFRAWVRPSPDGQTLRGYDGFRARIPGRIPISLVVVERVAAVRGLGPTGPVEPPLLTRSLPECSPALSPRCTVR